MAGATPAISVMVTPVLVVGTSALAGNTLAAAISAARARPGRVRWATSGVGTTGHRVLEWVRAASRFDITHIPYKGEDLSSPTHSRASSRCSRPTSASCSSNTCAKDASRHWRSARRHASTCCPACPRWRKPGSPRRIWRRHSGCSRLGVPHRMSLRARTAHSMWRCEIRSSSVDSTGPATSRLEVPRRTWRRRLRANAKLRATWPAGLHGRPAEPPVTLRSTFPMRVPPAICRRIDVEP